MHVRTSTVIANQRPEHDGHGLAVVACHIMEHVLHGLHIVGALDQHVEPRTDFVLARGGDLMMGNLGIYTELLQHRHLVKRRPCSNPPGARESIALNAGATPILPLQRLFLSSTKIHRRRFLRKPCSWW
jgi:hypothetical protein